MAYESFINRIATAVCDELERRQEGRRVEQAKEATREFHKETARIVRNKSTPQSAEFWRAVEESAVTVRDMPAWKKVGVVIPTANEEYPLDGCTCEFCLKLGAHRP